MQESNGNEQFDASDIFTHTSINYHTFVCVRVCVYICVNTCGTCDKIEFVPTTLHSVQIGGSVRQVLRILIGPRQCQLIGGEKKVTKSGRSCGSGASGGSGGSGGKVKCQIQTAGNQSLKRPAKSLN